MKYLQALLITFCIWGILTVPGCSSQTPEKQIVYPSCEPRSNTDPGRLNIRAGAEDFGMVTPCSGKIEFYINPNSKTRVLSVDLEYLTMDDESVHREELRADLEELSTGMFHKEVFTSPIPGEMCRALYVVIRSISCFTEDGSATECPDIRVISPDALHSLRVEEKSVNVCSNGI